MDHAKEFLELAKQKASTEEWTPLGQFCYDSGQPSIVIRILFVLWKNLSQRLAALEAKQ